MIDKEICFFSKESDSNIPYSDKISGYGNCLGMKAYPIYGTQLRKSEKEKNYMENHLIKFLGGKLELEMAEQSKGKIQPNQICATLSKVLLSGFDRSHLSSGLSSRSPSEIKKYSCLFKENMEVSVLPKDVEEATSCQGKVALWKLAKVLFHEKKGRIKIESNKYSVAGKQLTSHLTGAVNDNVVDVGAIKKKLQEGRAAVGAVTKKFKNMGNKWFGSQPKTEKAKPEESKSSKGDGFLLVYDPSQKPPENKEWGLTVKDKCQREAADFLSEIKQAAKEKAGKCSIAKYDVLSQRIQEAERGASKHVFSKKDNSWNYNGMSDYIEYLKRFLGSLQQCQPERAPWMSSQPASSAQ